MSTGNDSRGGLQALAWRAPKPGQASVAVILHRNHLAADSMAPIDATVRALEKRGLAVLPYYSDIVSDYLGEKFLLKDGKPRAQVIITHQAMVMDAVLFSRTSNLYGLLTSDDPFGYFGALSLAVRTLSGKSPDSLIANLRDADNPAKRLEKQANAHSPADLPRWLWLVLTLLAATMAAGTLHQSGRLPAFRLFNHRSHAA